MGFVHVGGPHGHDDEIGALLRSERRQRDDIIDSAHRALRIEAEELHLLCRRHFSDSAYLDVLNFSAVDQALRELWQDGLHISFRVHLLERNDREVELRAIARLAVETAILARLGRPVIRERDAEGGILLRILDCLGLEVKSGREKEGSGEKKEVIYYEYTS